MAAGNEQATFGLNLGGNAAEAAKTTAGALEQLRARIASGTDAIKGMQEQLRFLRGSSDDVRQAKDQLKSKLDAERAALSAAAVQIQKQGTTYAALTTETRKLALEKDKLAEKSKKGGEEGVKARTTAMTAALKAAGGPLSSLKDKLDGLKEIAGEGGAGGAMSFMTLAVAGSVAAIAALVAGVGAAVYALGKFIVKGADAARSAGLLAEAVMGGHKDWAKNFGDQIDDLAMRLPTAKSELDKLGRGLAKNRIDGQLWVDTMNAVGQASAALGDDAGNKLKEFVERGRLMNRLQINPLEMIGTGIEFDDIAKALAASTHKGLDEARKALFEGRVPLGVGAKALRDAMEKQFGGINLRQMMSLENLAKKFGETLDRLTKNVDLEPLLTSVKEIASMFDTSSESGRALQQIVTVIGNDMGLSFKSATPLMKKFIYGMIIGAQELTIAYLDVRNALRDTFGDPKTQEGVDKLKIATTAGKLAMEGIAGAAITVGVVLGAAAAYVGVFVASLTLVPAALFEMGKSIGDTLKSFDWKKLLGANIIDGLLEGIADGLPKVDKAIRNLGASVKKAFTDTLKMRSPSRVFAEFGVNTAKGYALGVEEGTGEADQAVQAMAAPPAASGGGAGAPRSAVTVNVPVTIQVSGGADAAATAAALADPSVLEQITKTILDALNQGGIPVPT